MKAGLSALFAAILVLAWAAAAPASATDFSGLAFQPHSGRHLPLGLRLADEHGRAVPLDEFFAGKPVILVLEYLRCKTLCGLALASLATALETLPLDAGRDFQVVAVSIDPRDTPADATAAKAKYLAIYRHPDAAAGWHFLTGPQPTVERIAAAVGFRYRYDKTLDQYIHPVGFVVATPDGAISRYLLEIDPTTAELAAALGDAAQSRVQNLLTRLVLWCCDDPQFGRYTVPIEVAFTVANLGVMAGGIIVFSAIRRRRNG